MGDVKLAFIIQKPPYKSETPKLGLTHAISYQTVEILLDSEDDSVTPTVCLVGDGVLNCLKDQKAMENYGIIPTEMHVKSSLLVDLKVLVCKEDLDKFGISEDRLTDAEDMGADEALQVVPYDEIQKAIEESNHVLFF
jgi:sulfur relay (sulfurtransferase) DsrF/TusC family protein